MSLRRRQAVPDVPVQLPGAIGLPLPDHHILGDRRCRLPSRGLNRQGDLPYFVGDVSTPAHLNGCQCRAPNPAIPCSLPKLSDGFVSADHLTIWRKRDRVGCVHRRERLGVAACEGFAELGVRRLDSRLRFTHALIVPFRACVSSRRTRNDQRKKDSRPCGHHAHPPLKDIEPPSCYLKVRQRITPLAKRPNGSAISCGRRRRPAASSPCWATSVSRRISASPGRRARLC